MKGIAATITAAVGIIITLAFCIIIVANIQSSTANMTLSTEAQAALDTTFTNTWTSFQLYGVLLIVIAAVIIIAVVKRGTGD